MFRPEDNDPLVRGLAKIPLPSVSRDFDSRVLGAVGDSRRSWWIGMLHSARPAIAGSVCALPVMLFLIALAQNPGVEGQPSSPSGPSIILTDSDLDAPLLTPLSIRRPAPAVTLNEPEPPARSGNTPTHAIAS